MCEAIKITFLSNPVTAHLFSHRYIMLFRYAPSPCSKFTYIFIFSGKTGRQHCYKDEWLNTNNFSYTGEGQIGDMKFTKGNLALRDHLAHGKRVFLFYIKGGGVVEFVDEVEFEDVGLFGDWLIG